MNETGPKNRQIKLKAGRMLGYAEYGAAEGKPIFCIHGCPGSRRARRARALRDTDARNGLRTGPAPDG